MTLRKPLAADSAPAAETGRTTEFDCAVGRRIQMRRVELKLTKKRLGELVGVTGMQIAYHESGTRRLGAERLYDLSVALGVPITFFFSDLDTPAGANNGSKQAVQVIPEHKERTVDMIVRLGKLAASIEDQQARATVREMLRSLPLFAVDDT